MNTREDEESAVVGVVKWFDPVKGFGFVVSDAGGPDILLHVNVLRNFGQSSVADGSRITMTVQRTDRGVQAIHVTELNEPQPTDTAGLLDIASIDLDSVADAPLVPARVKWFDKGKGFGFATIFGRREDIFLHMEVLSRSGLSDLGAGEALALRVIEGKRGHMAAEVFAWEVAFDAEKRNEVPLSVHIDEVYAVKRDRPPPTRPIHTEPTIPPQDESEPK